MKRMPFGRRCWPRSIPEQPVESTMSATAKIHSLRDIIATICAMVGRRPPLFFLPTRPTRWAARAADGLARLAGRSLNLTTAVDKFVEDVAVRGDRIRRELQFHPSYGLQEGWRQAVAAWQAGATQAGTAHR